MSGTLELGATMPGVRTEAHVRAIERELTPAVRFLVDMLGKGLVARVVGRDLKTVGRWLSGQGPRSDDEQRMVWDTSQIVELLLSQNYPSTVRAWFMGMNPELDDESPAEVLAQDDGQVRAVMRAARSFVKAE